MQKIAQMAPPLVTLVGGAGFIGSAATEVFANAGYRVRIACRNPAHARHLKPLGDLGQIGAVQADVRAPRSLAAAVAGSDVVVNLVGLFENSGGQSLEEINVQGAENVARAAAQAGVPVFIHISVVGADPASESAALRSRAAGEEAVRAAFPAAAIVRPSAVFGAGDRFTNRLASMLASSPVVPVISPETLFQPVYVGDLADAILAIANGLRNGDSPNRANTAWEIGGPEQLSIRSILETVSAFTGQKTQLVDTPDIGARLLSGFSFLKPASLAREDFLLLKRNNVAAPGAPGLAELGITPAPLAALAGEWLSRYRAGGRFAVKA